LGKKKGGRELVFLVLKERGGKRKIASTNSLSEFPALQVVKKKKKVHVRFP